MPISNVTRIFLVFIFSFALNANAQTPFSLDSAAKYLHTLVVEIGPRPMGSPSERRAMEFAVAKFMEFGLREAYILPMTSVESDALGQTANTRSGIAVGILPGATDRMIVIGGHIDSAGPEIPGANDDGSGSATVIELARILSQRRNESTLVFCLFGGEEQGLRGSKYFVHHFSQIGKVVLMLQVDMANGSDWLIPLIDHRGKSSPRWLVRASFEEFQKLGYQGLSYPTDFFALNSVFPGGGIGSDHMPFLERNIPSIDFTSDFNDPIHTPQDNFELFKISGLKRSGDLVYKIVERFDDGVPEEKTEEYYFAHVGSWLIFIPKWALYVFLGLTICIAGLALYRLRGHRVEIDKVTRPKIPALKMFLLMLIIQTCVWSSEVIVGWAKGVRYTWYADPTGYFVLGGLGGVIGVWIALQIVPRLNLSSDPYRYFLRSVVFLTVLLLLTGLLSIKAAVYPGMALLLVCLAGLVRKSWLKVAFWMFSPFFMYRLVFNEGFTLFARVLPEATVTAGIGFGIFCHVFLVVFFSIWFFPFLLSFASLYKESNGDFFWLNSFKQKVGIMLAGLAFVVCVIWLTAQPSYSELWKQSIRLDEHFDYSTGRGSVYIRSSEYLRGTRIRFDDKDTTLWGWTREFKLKDIETDQEPWITVGRTVYSAPKDSGTTINILATLRLKHRPYSLTLSYSGGRHHLKDAGSGLAATTTSRTVSLRWYSFPDTILLAPIHFTIADADSITELVEATFVEPLAPVEIQKDLAHVTTRTTVRQSTMLKASSFLRK